MHANIFYNNNRTFLQIIFIKKIYIYDTHSYITKRVNQLNRPRNEQSS